MDGVGLEFLETTLESLCTSAEHVIVACFIATGRSLD